MSNKPAANEVDPVLSTYRKFALVPSPEASWWQKLLCFIGIHSMRVVSKMYVGQFYMKCKRPGCDKDSVWEP